MESKRSLNLPETARRGAFIVFEMQEVKRMLAQRGNAYSRLLLVLVVSSALVVPPVVRAQGVTIADLNKYGTWESGLNNDVEEAVAAVEAYLAAHPLTEATKNQPDAELIYAPIYQIRCWDALVQRMVNDKPWRDWQRAYKVSSEFCTLFPQAATVQGRLLFFERMQALGHLFPGKKGELRSAAEAAADRFLNGGPLPGTFAHQVREIAQVLAETKSPKDALEWLQTLAPRQPAMYPQAKYWDALVNTYLLLGMKAEAKQAAMTWFRICPFRRDDVHAALTRLTKVCLGDLSEKQLEALMTYLDTGQGENPLADVKMPKVSDEQLAAILANVASPYDRQIILLYGSHFNEAMVLTMQMVADGSMELWEIGRCFKAEDGHMGRANRYIEFMRTGQGENPLATYQFGG